MAKEIVAWCDACIEEDPDSRVPATTTPPMQLGGGKARTMDLCERHTKELVQPLLDALESYGVVPQPNPVGRPPRAVAKPAEGVGVGAHKRSRRRDGDGPAKVKWGTLIWGPFECKVKGCRGRGSSNLDAFYQHLRARHGITPDEYEQKYGAPGPGRPDLPVQRERLAGVWRCQDCDTVFTTEDGAASPPSTRLAAHMRREHGTTLA